MNAFVSHHQDSIRFTYSCFDRMLLNAVIQVLQYPASVVGFFKQKRQATALTPAYFRSISTDYHQFVQTFAAERQVEIVQPPKDIRREDWVEPFFRRLHGQPGVAVILKSRENARVAVSFPKQGNHIELLNRFVWQYYFYLQDRDFGRMFIRVCPYFPFNSRICINGHEWLACRLREEGIRFQQCGNAFRNCADPERLQALADQFAPQPILACGHRWLAQLVPFFTDQERRRQGFGYRLFVSQVEYCTNLIFDRRAALDRLSERLLDLNRTIGAPDKVAVIFGRRLTKQTDAGLKTQISDHGLGQPVIRSDYKSSSIKQYVRDHLILRNEATSYHTPDLGVGKNVDNLPQLREKMAASTERYLDVQQDVLETFVDRGQLAQLRQPTVTPSGRRTPGLKLDDPRLLAVLQALTCFAYLAGTGCFRTKDLHPTTAKALGQTTDSYTLAQLRYDLAKLRAKGLVERVAGTQAYRLPPTGYRLAVMYLKLFHKIYAPLTAGTLKPVAADERLPPERQAMLDRLYTAVDHALQQLCEQVGLKLAG
jgi:hypothetical protein